MTRFGFDWQWDYEHGAWCIYPHVDEEAEHKALVNDFNAGLKSDPHAR